MVVSLAPTLTFQDPVSLGTNAPELIIGASAGLSVNIIERTPASTALFSPDDYGENIEILAGSCYVGLGFNATAAPGIQATSGSLTFGLTASVGIDVESYQQFSAGVDAPTIADALVCSVKQFVLPASVPDLESLSAGAVVTVTGTGALTFSASANLLTVANPLATVPLIGPLPAISVQQGTSITVGASWKIAAAYQIRVQKTSFKTVRLGWYREHGSDFTVTASASAGLTAGPGQTGSVRADRDRHQFQRRSGSQGTATGGTFCKPDWRYPRYGDSSHRPQTGTGGHCGSQFAR